MRTTPSLFRTLLCSSFFLFIIGSVQAQPDSQLFPFPDSIRSAVNFWIRVYTEVDTNSGFLHDNQDLSIVYERMTRDNDAINRRRREIAEDLKVLATGKRSDLTTSQRRILELWGDKASNQRLATAADNIRWQLGQSDRFLQGLQRSGAYRPHIQQVIREKGLPQELGALPHVESSFHPGAFSSAAASGMWQFMKTTAIRFMQVDYVVDERLDPYESTYGAMSLLEYNYKALGTWPLALTAYNHGSNGMARAVDEMKTTDIGKIISDYKGPRFGFASRNFYPQFLAVLEVERRAREFFGPVRFERAPDFARIELKEFVDAAVVAHALGVSMGELQRDNPALQPAVWAGTKRIPRGYKLKIDRSSFSGDIASVIASIPGSQRFTAQIPDATYEVQRGDSLSVIARRFNTSINELVAINQLRDRHTIRVGQTLLLPGAAEANQALQQVAAARAAPAPSTVAARPSTSQPRNLPTDGKYVVVSGDTLSVISNRFRVPEDQLLALNGLRDRNRIYPGQTLTLVAEQQQDAEPAPLQTATAVLAMLGNVDEVLELEDIQTLGADWVGTGENQTVFLAQLSMANEVALEVNQDMLEQEAEAQLLVDLSVDPTDYSVRGSDGSIEIQEAETLGHYADWLEVSSANLRRLNNMGGQHVISGSRIKLDFSKVDAATFERKRREYHRDMQARYFDQWRIQGTEEYSIKRSDLLATLVRQRSVPMWLFRQYNPDVNSARIQIGQKVVFPKVERASI